MTSGGAVRSASDEGSSDEDKPFECLVCLEDVRLHEGVFPSACLHALLLTELSMLCCSLSNCESVGCFDHSMRSDDAADFLDGRRTATGPAGVSPSCPSFPMRPKYY